MYGLGRVREGIERRRGLQAPVPHPALDLRERAVVVPEEVAGGEAVAPAELVVAPDLGDALVVDGADELAPFGVFVDGGRLPVHVRCLIDECANIGQIPNLEKLVATIRSREISACLVLQAQSQLKALYKDNADTIIGNMDSMVFLGGKEKTTLKEMAETLGKETIDTYNTGESRGREISHSLNYQKLGKELMSVDELAVMDGSKCILQLRGVRPFLSDKYDITKHPYYKYLSDADPRNAFDIEKFLSRELELKEKDSYDTYEIAIDEDEYDMEPGEDAPDESKRTAADYGSLTL